jgi:hypothetical protein
MSLRAIARQDKVLQDKVLFGGLIFISALLYGVFFFRRPVGYLGDDAGNILAAQSLLQGRYVVLQLPTHPSMKAPLPGYPLFLAPFVACVRPHWSLLKGTSWALTLVSVFLLWKLTAGFKCPLQRWAAVMLYGLNPTTAYCATPVMPEPLFMTILLLTFLLFERGSLDRGAGHFCLLGLLAGAAALVRPEGIVLIPAVFGGLMLEMRVKGAMCFLLPALVLGSLGWGNTFMHLVNSPMGHDALLQRCLSAPWQEFLLHAEEVLRLQVVGNMLNLWFQPKGLLYLMLIVSFCIAVIYGGYRLWNEKGISHGLFAAIALFNGFYLGIHLIWLGMDFRYFWIPLPFLSIALSGLLGPPQKRPLTVIATGGLVVMLSLLVIQDMHAAAAIASGKDRVRLLRKSYAWVRAQTDPESFFLVPGSSTFYLYTGRYAVGYIPANNAEDLWYKAQDYGVSHLWQAPASFSSLTDKSVQPEIKFWSDVGQWMIFRPDLFERVYKDEEDHVDVFRIRPDARFRAAYRLFLSALPALNRQAFAEAIPQLRSALQSYSESAEFHNALGVAYAQQANIMSAEKQFRESLRIDPSDEDAGRNLRHLIQLHEEAR